MKRREWFRANWRFCATAILASTGAALSISAQSQPLQSNAASELKAAVDALQWGRNTAAIAILKGLDRKLPKLADYVAWFHASSEFSA